MSIRKNLHTQAHFKISRFPSPLRSSKQFLCKKNTTIASISAPNLTTATPQTYRSQNKGARKIYEKPRDKDMGELAGLMQGDPKARSPFHPLFRSTVSRRTTTIAQPSRALVRHPKSWRARVKRVTATRAGWGGGGTKARRATSTHNGVYPRLFRGPEVFRPRRWSHGTLPGGAEVCAVLLADLNSRARREMLMAATPDTYCDINDPLWGAANERAGGRDFIALREVRACAFRSRGISIRSGVAC